MKRNLCLLAYLLLLGGVLSTAVSYAHATDPPYKLFLPVVQKPIPPRTILPKDAQTLALFPLDGNTQDISGHNRHATLISGTFVPTAVGQGLQLVGNREEAGQGFHWNSYANLLTHPYTIEMIVTPTQTNSYGKLFSFTDNSDSGWYYFLEGLRIFPFDTFGAGQVRANEEHYIAFVSLDSENVAIYFQGVLLGTSSMGFVAPPGEAIFFNDDASTSRFEQLKGVVEEVRISGVSRTAVEIQAVQASR